MIRTRDEALARLQRTEHRLERCGAPTFPTSEAQHAYVAALEQALRNGLTPVPARAAALRAMARRRRGMAERTPLEQALPGVPIKGTLSPGRQGRDNARDLGYAE